MPKGAKRSQIRQKEPKGAKRSQIRQIRQKEPKGAKRSQGARNKNTFCSKVYSKYFFVIVILTVLKYT
jgi:hypothetical protein